MGRTFVSHKKVQGKIDTSQEYDKEVVFESATVRTSRDANATLRVSEAMKLRAQKIPYAEIAKRCGYASAGSCYTAIQREMQRTIITDTEELRRDELHMLDTLHASIWPLAIDENNKGRLFAVDRIISISERRAKLMGLDIPVDSAQFAQQIIIREIPQGLLSIEEGSQKI